MVVEFNRQTYEHPVVLGVFLLLVAVDGEVPVAGGWSAEVSHSLGCVPSPQVATCRVTTTSLVMTLPSNMPGNNATHSE